MRYADRETVYRHCFNSMFFDPDDPENAQIVFELEQIEEGVAALIDKKCNRTFGSAPVAEARVVSDYRMSEHQLLNTWFWPVGLFSTTYTSYVDGDPVYILPWGVRNVTKVETNGDWNGSGWTNPNTLTPSGWRTIYKSEGKGGWAYGIVVSGAGHNSTVRVTGEWADQSAGATVPPEIREAATFITADMFRTRELSPAGELGPDGLATYVRNVWEEPMVKDAIEANTFRQLVI